MSNFEKIQKAALARIEAGENLEHILQDYADYEEELRPILEEATGTSIASLLQNPKSQKPKNKAKNDAPSWHIPAIAGALAVVLISGIIIMLGLGRGTDVITPQPLPITPTSADILANDDACAGLAQPQIKSTYTEVSGQTTSGSVEDSPIIGGTGGGMTSPEMGLIVGDAPMATPRPAGTMPPPSELSASSASSGGSMGGGFGGDADTTTTSDRGIATGSSAESPSSIAVVSGGSPIIPTSVASYDVRSESDDYADPEVGGEVAEASSDTGGIVHEESILNSQVVLQPLRAGEIDDNADWDTYQEYRNNFLAEPYRTYGVRDVDTTDRQVIRVIDANGLPVLGACVQIYRGESFITAARTYATGMTLFFPNLSETTRYVETFRVVVTKAGTAAEGQLDRNAIGGVTTITLQTSQREQNTQLDVLFLLDATGSMADEIAQLQDNILTISAQIDELPNNVDVRFGLVSYRDRGDEYITRVYDFTTDVQVFQDNLMTVVAGGGGDYPESLNAGFDMALNAVNWRGENTIKLVFLVADAPPHVDYANDADYSLLIQDALARGIKVHPIGSSGLEPEGEFVLRQIAQFTMGHFIFLTYDEGVAGTVGDDRPDLEVGEVKDEQGIGDYSVSQLDEMVLRLITDEIAALRGE